MKHTVDFIVIGAQKAGTTSLFEYLRRHPEICLPPGKEAPYFSHDRVRAHGWDDYMRKTFAFANPACKWGTVTPSYMIGGVYDAEITSVATDNGYDERTVPLRIRERLPNVRLVAILRDPVERARSHHRMALMNGLEQRSFDEAVDRLLHPDSIESFRRCPKEETGYVAWGEYGRILAGYFDVFPREQILVVFTEELEHSPEQVLFGIHEFLGVDANFVPDNLGTTYRVAGTARRFSWLRPKTMQQAIASNAPARTLWHGLPEICRRWVNRGFDHLTYRIDLWNRRKSTNVDDPTPAILGRLREHFAQETDQLVALLEEVPPWQR